MPFPGSECPHQQRQCGNVLLLSSRGHIPDCSCSGCGVLSKGLFFSAEHEAAMDRRFGLEPGTLFRGLKKVGWVTDTTIFYFVAIARISCFHVLCSPKLLIWLQRFVVTLQIWIFIANFSLLLVRKRDLLGVSRSKNHNQSFVSFPDPWPKYFSFIMSLSLLIYCLALKAVTTLDIFFSLFPVTVWFG